MRRSLKQLGLVLSRLVMLLAIPFGTGCGTLQNGRGWGQDALWPIQWERIPKAAMHAVLDPVTWVPAIGAAFFAIGDWDEETAKWASKETPIFGSTEKADNMSDNLRHAL